MNRRHKVAKAIGDYLYGYCDPDETQNTWSAALGAADVALKEISLDDWRWAIEQAAAAGMSSETNVRAAARDFLKVLREGPQP